MVSWFEYSVTRPFTLRYFTPMLLALGTVWVAFVTIVTIAAVGYETVSVQVTASEFNSSSKVWYEKLFPTSQWIPASMLCDGSRIKVKDSIHFQDQD